jgi:hypothetical protein
VSRSKRTEASCTKMVPNYVSTGCRVAWRVRQNSEKYYISACIELKWHILYSSSYITEHSAPGDIFPFPALVRPAGRYNLLYSYLQAVPSH